jgi:hypothetical protein
MNQKAYCDGLSTHTMLFFSSQEKGDATNLFND